MEDCKITKKVDRSRIIAGEFAFLSLTKEMKIKAPHMRVLQKMHDSCLEQLNEGRKVTGYLQYRHSCQYDPETQKEIENEQSEEVHACYELCGLGIFDTDDEAWHLVFNVADGIDWTTL